MRKKEREILTKTLFRPTYESMSQHKVTTVVGSVINDLKRKYSRSRGCFLSFIDNCPYQEQCRLVGLEMCPIGLSDVLTNHQYYTSEEHTTLCEVKKLIDSSL